MSEPNVIVAVQDAESCLNCCEVLRYFGFEPIQLSSCSEIDEYVSSHRVKLLVADLYFEDGASFKFYSENKQYESIKCIGVANILYGEGVIRFLIETLHYSSVLYSPVCLSDFEIALQETGLCQMSKQTDSPFLPYLLPFQMVSGGDFSFYGRDSMSFWLRYDWERHQISRNTSVGLPAGEVSLSGMEMEMAVGTTPVPVYSECRMPTGADIQKKKVKNEWWQDIPSDGDFRYSPFSAVLWKLMKEKFSGVLKIRRSFISEWFYFKEGCPVSEWSDDPLHSLLAYMKFHQILTPAQWTSLRHACDIGRSELDALRQLVGREALQKFRSEHLRACLLEIFGWENGTYVCQKVSFCEENIVDQSLDCGISLLQAGIFTKIPMYRILQRLEFIVPYFLKLTVDKKNVLNFDVTAQTDAVLDYLERGGTLVEMLVHLPSDCPVHRLVYLLLVLGYLDLT